MRPKQFPLFKDPELDALRKKIIAGVSEDWKIARRADQEHFDRAYLQGKEWTRCPCWLHAAQWDDGRGFKKFKFKGHTLYIHRTSCHLFNGEVPPENLVDHLCRVRGCCQPVHLESVTPKENTLRGANENNLLRNGAPPPVTARSINPRYGDVPTIDEIKNEFVRRDADGSDIKRVHDTATEGPLPVAPEGFRWRSPGVGMWGSVYYLQPIRSYATRVWPTAETERDGGARDRASDMVAQCYTQQRGISGVTLPDARLVAPTKPATLTVHPNEATIPLRTGAAIPVHFATEQIPVSAFDGIVDRYPEYKQYEFGVRAPVSPVGPDNGYVPETSSGSWLRHKLFTAWDWLRRY